MDVPATKLLGRFGPQHSDTLATARIDADKETLDSLYLFDLMMPLSTQSWPPLMKAITLYGSIKVQENTHPHHFDYRAMSCRRSVLT